MRPNTHRTKVGTAGCPEVELAVLEARGRSLQLSSKRRKWFSKGLTMGTGQGRRLFFLEIKPLKIHSFNLWE